METSNDEVDRAARFDLGHIRQLQVNIRRLRRVRRVDPINSGRRPGAEADCRCG
jgi:hypothetical protein